MNQSTIEALVEQHLAGLRRKPIADLVLLPKLAEEIVEVHEKKVRLCTFHETVEAKRHRFIVQGVQERWGGITAKIVAQGFEIASDQSLRALSQEELYDFT
jgi:hypothetical protein